MWWISSTPAPLEERLVKAAVEFREHVHLLRVSDQHVLQRQQASGAADERGIGRGGKAPDDFGLGSDAQEMRLLQRRLVDAGHHGARLRADAHQPVLLQQLKGLADRRQADPVFGRKVCPAEHRVGRKIEVQNPRPEAFVNRFRGRPGGALGQQALGRSAMDHDGRPAKRGAIG